MVAVDKYNYTLGNRFSTYATYWIWQGITRALAQKTRLVRVPTYITERISRMYRTAQLLEQELGRRPIVQEVAAKMELSVEDVLKLMVNSQDTLALEQPVGSEDNEIGDLIEDTQSPNPVESATQNLLRRDVEKILSKLPERQRGVRPGFGKNTITAPR
ncbi:MAG TPA: sigma-70 domain-containing protein [Aggregatilineales bacterium]|nr:sigma-70 domain-containing protein [Aggregatilineales bacterium]